MDAKSKNGKKRRKLAPAEDLGCVSDSSGEDWDEEEDGSSDSSSVDSQLEIQVEFEAREIEEADFHGVRRLLQQLLLKGPVDISALANLIIENSHIGSTIKVASSDEEEEVGSNGGGVGDEDTELYGITTVINLTDKSKACVAQLSDHLLSQCKAHSPSQLPQLQDLLTKSGKTAVGLLLNERVLNIPPDIAPPLLNSLLSELKMAQKQGRDVKYSHYIIIARSHFLSLPPPAAVTGTKRGRKGKAAAVSSSADGSLMFDHYENELLHEESVFSFSYPVGEQGDTVLGGCWSFDDEAMKSSRTVLVVAADRMKEAVTELERTITS